MILEKKKMEFQKGDHGIVPAPLESPIVAFAALLPSLSFYSPSRTVSSFFVFFFTLFF